MLTATSPETHPSALEAWEELLDHTFERIFPPRPRLTVSQWAARNRMLSSETSAEAGPWLNERVPYLVEIMDALSDPEVTEMVIMKSKRVGYTEGVIGNGIGYFVDQEPCPVLVLQPAEGDAEDWSKRQLAPMIRDCEVLAKRFTHGSKDTDNTILDKKFTGGSITIRGAHSPRGLRRITVRVVFMDEVSAFQTSAGGHGDPVKLGEGRADTFENRKIVKGSTPIDVARCRITKDFKRSDQRYWHVPCPHCEHEQILKWGGPDKPFGIKWSREVRCHRCKREMEPDADRCSACKCAEREIRHLPETAYYLCENCSVPIEETDKEWMVQHGRFVKTNPESKVPGWHINSLISLISAKARWASLVQEWLDSQEDPELLQVFINEVLGEAYEDRGTKFSPKALENRASAWVGKDGTRVDIPNGVAVLTSFVDVQKDRLEVLIRGWGDREESWGILHHRIHVSPFLQEAWQQLEAIRTHPYVHQSGAVLRVHSMLVDAGWATDAVYAYTRGREDAGVYASVGRAGEGKAPLSRPSTANSGKVPVITIGVDTLKDRLFSRLRINTPGPGYMHFSAQDDERFNGFDAEYFAQFGREKKVPKKSRSKGMRYEWVASGRNEAVDLEVGALAALHLIAPAERARFAQRAREIIRLGEKHQESAQRAQVPVRRKRRKLSGGFDS